MKQSTDDTHQDRKTTGSEGGLEVDQPPEVGGQRPSTASDDAWSTGAGESSTGFDSPPADSLSPSNEEASEPQHPRDYYPAGAPPEGGSQPDDETT